MRDESGSSYCKWLRRRRDSVLRSLAMAAEQRDMFRLQGRANELTDLIDFIEKSVEISEKLERQGKRPTAIVKGRP